MKEKIAKNSQDNRYGEELGRRTHNIKTYYEAMETKTMGYWDRIR